MDELNKNYHLGKLRKQIHLMKRQLIDKYGVTVSEQWSSKSKSKKDLKELL